MGMSRQELEQAIREQVSPSYRVIESDLDEPEDAASDADALVDAVRSRYETLLGLSEAKHYAIVTTEDDDRAADLRGPVRRVTVIDDHGNVEAEQG